MEKAVASTTGGSPSRIDDDPTRFRIVVRIEAGDGVRIATVQAPGIFDITAPIAAMVAERTLHDTFAVTGAASPAEVVRPTEMCEALAAHGLSYQL